MCRSDWPDDRRHKLNRTTGRTTSRRPGKRRRQNARRMSRKCEWVYHLCVCVAKCTYPWKGDANHILAHIKQRTQCTSYPYHDADPPPKFQKSKSTNVHNKQNNSEAVPTGMFFQYNTSLGPPFRVLVDTNFINFSIKNKVWGCRGPIITLPPPNTNDSSQSNNIHHYQPTNQPTAGDVQGHDGLPPRQVHPLRLGLRHGGAREAGGQVYARAPVRSIVCMWTDRFGDSPSPAL